MDQQQRGRLTRAVVDHVHPRRVLTIVFAHASDDAPARDVGLGQMFLPGMTALHAGQPGELAGLLLVLRRY
jgi:hypothetical protein